MSQNATNVLLYFQRFPDVAGKSARHDRNTARFLDFEFVPGQTLEPIEAAQQV
jgi:hypothetical protein